MSGEVFNLSKGSSLGKGDWNLPANLGPHITWETAGRVFVEKVGTVEKEDSLWLRDELIQNNAQLYTGLPGGSE